MHTWKLMFGLAVAMFNTHVMSAMVSDSASGCQVAVEYPQPGEVTHWNGPCVSGFAEGLGRLVSSNGTDLVGEFKSGKPFNATGRSFLVLNIGIKKVVSASFKEGRGVMAPAQRTKDDTAAYASALRAKIVPLIAPVAQVEGNPAVTVEINLSFQGKVLNARVVQSSGNADWDDSVLRAIHEAKTLPLDPLGDYLVQIAFRPKPG